MDSNEPALQSLIDRVRGARRDGTPLCIRGGGTKDFYGETPAGATCSTRASSPASSSYEPTELVVTARCGTPLAELEALLAEHGQCLPFEPPRFGPGGTVGGMVARRPVRAVARRASARCATIVLGATLLDGNGEVLQLRRPGHQERRRLRRLARCSPARWARSASSSRSR